MGVLDGLRVLDLTWGVAGPMATMLLADHGADVIRVERPQGEPFVEPAGYRVWHRGKRSAVLDLHHPGDHATFLALARDADIVVDSFAPGVLTALGIDHASLSAANPALISCSVTAYGSDTALAQRPGYDALVAARMGVLWEDRGRHGSFGVGPRRPVFPANPAPSTAAAYLAVLGISAALRAREVTGRGQRVETSLLQGVLHYHGYGWLRADHPEAMDYAGGMLGAGNNWGIYRAADGWICNWPGTPEWAIAAASGGALHQPEPGEYVAHRSGKPRVLSDDERMAIVDAAAEAFARYTVDEWVALGARMNIGIQPVRTPEEALADPALHDEGSVTIVDDAELGRTRQVGVLYRLRVASHSHHAFVAEARPAHGRCPHAWLGC